jgi:nucleotide-binding universal stress UspA family protein
MYKTIVVHVDGSLQQASRLQAPALLANAHDAHLVGVAPTGMSRLDIALLSGSMAVPVPLADVDQVRDAAAQRLQVFTEQAAQLGVASVEARLIEDAADYGLLLQSRYADLLVLSQDADVGAYEPATMPGAPRVRALPEQLALRGARPVLVVPESYAGEIIPGTVVAGWDGSMQALRALAGALPLLARADSVKLVLVNPDELSGLHGEDPGADMALYLARHGTRVEVVVQRSRASAGHALAALALDCHAGLLVIGAYGHSRYREWVLGGATRELLETTPVPLPMAH